MNPLFFGPANAPLYGVYHPPKAEPRAAGVVLCNAFGQEYMRAHRAYRQLALLLTRKGFHVLRFDYRGTGDSSGDLDGVTARHWLEDIDAAITELRATVGAGEISVLGLRLGALFAAAACRDRSDIARLLLWDPICSGSEYEAELLAEIAATPPPVYEVPSGNAELADGGLQYNGFTMPASFRASLRELRLTESIPTGVPMVLQAVSHENDAFAAVRETFRAHPGFRYQYAAAPHDWNYVDNFGGILLPQPVIQAIVNWMDTESRR